MKEFIEIIYYLSGIIVAIGVVYSIQQYALYKKDIKLKYNREIITITNEQLRFFYTKILPRYEEIKRELNGTVFFIKKDVLIVDLNNTDLKESCLNYISSQNNNSKLLSVLKTELVDLQIFSVNFDFGAADTELVRKTVSNKYIEIFESVLPIIFFQENTEIYKSSIDLYNQWKVQLLDEDNKNQANKINSAKNFIETFKVKNI